MNTLKDVIDNIIITKDDNNSLFRHARRTHIRSLAKRGLKQIEYKLDGNVRAISFNVPMSQQVPLPSDYDDYVRVSVMDGCDIYPVAYNDTIPASVETYIQDCANELIYDCCNEVMSVKTTTSCRHCEKVQSCNQCETLNVCDSENDYWFNTDDDNFIFSPDLEGKKIFVEYISTGWTEEMDECEIKLKGKYNELLLTWITWQYLRSINAHMGRIEEYRRYYKTLKKEVDVDDLNIDNNAIIKILNHRFER